MIFHHSGKPFSKQRPRLSKRAVYDPQFDEKMQMKWEFSAQMRAQGISKPLEGPIDVEVEILFAWPKSWTSSYRKTHSEIHASRMIKKPDVDNVVKFYFDVLNKIAYVDDAQICTMMATKRYADEDGVKIVVNNSTNNKNSFKQKWVPDANKIASTA